MSSTKKNGFFLITAIILLTSLLSHAFIPWPGKFRKDWQVENNKPKIKTVVIDAGHGGHDPGCLGASSQEKHIALAIAQKLAAALRHQHPDLKIILTRDRDVFIPLHERAAIANRNNADLFISIHCNFMPGSSATHGSETYVMGLHTAEYNLQVAKRENAAILLEENYEQHYDYDPNSPEGHIILTMFQNAFLEQSILFAEAVEEKLASHAQRRSRGVKQAGFVVLKATSMPSVLIEAGFLSNGKEEQFLSTEAGQQQIAESIALAFNRYRTNFEQDTPLASSASLSNPTPAAASSSSPVQPTAPVKADEPAIRSSPVYANVPPPPTAPKGSTNQNSAPLPLGAGMPSAQTTASANPGSLSAPTNAYQFYVQLAASSQAPPANDRRWVNLPFTIEAAREDNLYKYRTRSFASANEAMEARNQLRQLGFPDAFVTAYQNGKRIPLEEAMKK